MLQSMENSMKAPLTRINNLFDRTHYYWTSHYSKNLAAVILLAAYLLGLAAPDYYNAALGVGSALYILGLNAVYNFYGCLAGFETFC